LPVEFCAVEFALTIDEEGRKNVAIYDHRGGVVRSIDGDNVDNTQHSSNYRYGAFNRLIEARDNLGLVTSFTYDDYLRQNAPSNIVGSEGDEGDQ
jgi:YD repeat-containing protein